VVAGFQGVGSLRLQNKATAAVRAARGIVAVYAKTKSTTVTQRMSRAKRKGQHTLKGF
jgi:hypothetical protein